VGTEVELVGGVELADALEELVVVEVLEL